MEALRDYLEVSYSRPDKSFDRGEAMRLLQKAEDEHQHHKEAYAGAMVKAYEYQAQLTTLKAAVREYFEAEKFPVGKLPPTNSRIRYVAAEQALRKAVE